MPNINIEEGETKEIITQPDTGERYQIGVKQGELAIGKSASYVKQGMGREIYAGDRIEIEILEANESVYVYAREPSRIEVTKQGFNLTFGSRKSVYQIDSVQTREAGFNGGFGSITVDDTPTELVSSDIDRLSITIQNKGNYPIYLGIGDDASNVTVNNSIEIGADGDITLSSYVGQIYAITTSGNTCDVRILEEVD